MINKRIKTRVNTPYYNNINRHKSKNKTFKHLASPHYNTTRTTTPQPLNTQIIGLVHANWCGQCTSLMPEWHKMKVDLQNINNMKVLTIEEANSQPQIDDINNTYLKHFSNKLEVNGYPTIFKITNNRGLEYYGGRRHQLDLVKWANFAVGGKIRKSRKIRKFKKNT